MEFNIIIEPAEEGGFNISVPALEGCYTQSDTEEEAMKVEISFAAADPTRDLLYTIAELYKYFPFRYLQKMLTISNISRHHYDILSRFVNSFTRYLELLE